MTNVHNTYPLRDTHIWSIKIVQSKYDYRQNLSIEHLQNTYPLHHIDIKQ